MAQKNHSEHARVTAICVNLALDQVEADIRRELDESDAREVQIMKRLLERVREHRVSEGLTPSGTC